MSVVCRDRRYSQTRIMESARKFVYLPVTWNKNYAE